MKRRSTLALLLGSLALLAALPGGAAASHGVAGHHKATAKHPMKVLIVLFDQLRPEYPDRFGMTNFQSVRDGGRYFKKSYVGYMGSETVISHNVIVSGQLPKHMGWVDEAYRDTENLLGGGAGKMWVTGDLSLDQFQTLVEHEGYPKLADYLHTAQPGSKFITVGEKSYAVESATAGTGDIGVRLSSRVSDGSCPSIGIYRKPTGRNVPGYLSDPCGRFFINSDKANDFGTLGAFPSWMYPEDGNRFFPGHDPAHLGGDVWAADAAMAMMEHENWSGMFVTLGGIDKAGHMWGAYHDAGVDPSDPGFQTHVPEAARTADEQFGRILTKLRELGQLDDTLIVLTADHGATYAANFYGKPTLNAGDTNWYYGDSVNDGLFNAPSPALAPLIATGNVQFSYQSTSIQAWLTEASRAKQQEAAAAMMTMPGVMATYRRVGHRFKLVAKTTMTKSESRWWKRHGQEIVDTMAGDSGPDVVALLHDETAYSVLGDHGSASENDQRIPIVFWKSGMSGGKTGAKMRNVDILPTILRAMGIKQTSNTDGRARSIGH
jgi:hypothetical protein